YWQREWLRGDVLDRQIGYWAAQLTDTPTLLGLPTDRPRPPIQSYRGANLSFTIPADITTRLHVLGKQKQSTLFMSLTAVFAILLSRYSGQSDICIGTPIANRNRTETEGLIGFFVNTLVLRTQIDDCASFTQLLEDVRETTLDAYAHQDVPFEQLVETLKPERSSSHHPLL
ncbi:non-ribosomal peptide synthetase, partial [Collimonas pratensis]|uniref:condensation domain-containing protein n=1 Tax=Collimonas pratensis TaxID=279113 RepID=UPI0019EDC1D4